MSHDWAHVIGDTLDQTDTADGYPASDGWTLKYWFIARDAGGSNIGPLSATVNADGVRYDLQVAPAVTATWTAGYYTIYRAVEKSGARQNLDGESEDGAGQLRLLPNPATLAAGHDSRTHARKVLDAIEAVIENRATLDQESYQINGRSLNRTPISELLKLRTIYRNEVDAEYRAKNDVTGGRKLVYRL